jgi:nucleoside-diphosphate-sugar epimerase
MRRAIFLGNALVDWCTAGRINHFALSYNLNAMPYTVTEAPFDCSKGAARLGYTPLYTMEEAYADICRELGA